MSTIPTYVAIPFRGKVRMTAEFVRRLLDDQSEKPKAILLMDNGTPENELKALREIEKRVIVYRRPDDSLTEMWNFAWSEVCEMESNGPANLAILNNDIDVSGGFLAVLTSALRSDDQWWAMSPDHPRADRIPNMEAGKVREVFDVNLPRPAVPLGGMCGWAFMVRTETPAPMPIDEQFRWYCGDDEVVDSVRQWGHKVGLVQELPCEHLVSETLTGRYRELEPVIAEDLRRYTIKRGKE